MEKFELQLHIGMKRVGGMPRPPSIYEFLRLSMHVITINTKIKFNLLLDTARTLFRPPFYGHAPALSNFKENSLH